MAALFSRIFIFIKRKITKNKNGAEYNVKY